jgi:CubicO group peptidase (beta-lactamase class C family)
MRTTDLSRLILAILFLALTVAGDAAGQAAPDSAWPRASPAAVGIEEAVLDSIDAEIRGGQYGWVDRFLVIRSGRLVYDRRYRHDYERIYGDSAREATALLAHHRTGPYNYFNDWWHPYYRRGELHSLQSVTKTVTSIIIGAAVARGEFPSLDTPVLSFFDTGSVANIDERKRRLTIRHLLTMTDGLDWDENRPYSDSLNTTIQLEASYDWVDFTIDRPMAREPGERFNYNSGASQLLAHIFEHAAGVDIEEYAAEHVFAPLGIHEWFWKRTPAGIQLLEESANKNEADEAALHTLATLYAANGSLKKAHDTLKRSLRKEGTDVLRTKDYLVLGRIAQQAGTELLKEKARETIGDKAGGLLRGFLGGDKEEKQPADSPNDD